ncbi:MAG: filamentous hemagglutinin family protein [Gammaproteobacteria bacterium]|nr:filamentous hemagglutinin family protein [Gammaproteobacteria bacterium]
MKRAKRLLRGAPMVALAAAPFAVYAEPLPVPCSACGAGHVPFAAPGVASVMTRGNTLTVTQHASRAVLNWQSFDIAKGRGVRFAQPSSNAIALNRIHQGSPSQIFGDLTANGQIYLINQNGIVFGRSARVDTQSLVASSLDMDDALFGKSGITGAINDASGAKPAFAGTGTLGAINVERGAELNSAEGGRIVLLAPEIKNAGAITTPGGQAIAAAAKDKVYLAAADGDPNLRGLVVEVETGGTVTNTGTLSAPRGNVTLLGYAVNQNGLASATTSVSVNGSVRLLARDHVQVVHNDIKNTNTPTALRAGVLTLGAHSRTEVTPVAASTDVDAQKAREADRTQREAVDSQPQVLSKIDLFGNKLSVASGAHITARGGDITVKAQRNTSAAPGESVDAKLEIAKGARIDAAGSRDAEVAMSRNLVSVELRGNELRDAPLQKNGLLRGKRVTFDVRKGTPLADVSGAVASIRRSLDERLAPGGSITLDSDNHLDVAPGATLDVSGGVVNYSGGVVDTTKLISGGRLFDISKADPGRVYDGVFGSAETVHRKWNVVESYQLFSNARANFEAGYVEGKDAGTLTIAAPDLRMLGNAQGGVTLDSFQRDKPGAAAGFQRPYDEQPLAGRLTLGRGSLAFDDSVAQNYLLDEVRLDAHAAPGASTSFKDDGALLTVSPRLFKDGGFERVGIFANGRVSVPGDVSLDLGAYGEMAIGAGVVEIAGTLSAADGRIDINVLPTLTTGNDATALTLTPGAELNTQGRWVNDNAARARNEGLGEGPLAINGGSVALNASGALDLQQGSLIDVGGGAHKTSKGALVAGKGGSITLSSDDALPTRMTLAGELRALALAKGGQLKLTGGGFAVQNDALARDNLTVLTPALFSAQGFADISINANRDGIRVAPDTRVDIRQRNRVPTAAMVGAVSGTDIDALTRVTYLDAAERAPGRLAMAFKRRANLPVSSAEVSMGSGALITADPQSSISLSSDTRLMIDGVISAPAGNVSLAIVNPRDGNDRGFDASQAVTLGSHAALLAPAAIRHQDNALGLRLGDVLNGGRVSLAAQRGYVLAEHGSRIDVSGSGAVFDLIDPSQPAQRTPTRVNAVGGEITLTAAEGMRLNGVLRGRQGGRLSVVLNPLDRETAADLTGLPAFPGTPREMRIGGAVLADVPRGSAVPEASNGQVVLSGATVVAGGFAALNLVTRPLLTGNDIDSIRFVGAQHLSLSRSLTLDTAVLASDGGAVQLAAPYVQLGTSNELFRRAGTASAGAGSLQVDAEFIDLKGDVALQGFGDQVKLASRGDVRLIGTRVPATSSTELRGSFNGSGDVVIDAARIYPSTLSNYTLASSGADASIAFSASTANSKGDGAPLSAGGSLTINAAHIAQGGRLFAPFGQLTLNAGERLSLTAGSVSSVSGAGLLMPFGQTQFGRQWVFPLATVTRVLETMPDKRVTLAGADVRVARGAVVDLWGGGDLLATEHVPGPGGSSDILAAAGASFAVVPTLQSVFAPYDPIESAAFGFAPDSSIELADNAVTAAGHYAVLPARYAVLPGALLLTPDHSGTDIVPGLRGQTSATLPLVAGRLGSAGGTIADTPWAGYRIESGGDWRLRAEYRETRASDFFVAGTGASTLPKDAGALSLAASQSLALSGRLLAGTPGGGRGAEMDIAAQHLAVVDDFSTRRDRVEIRAADLNAFGAQSLLLGGQRHRVDGKLLLEAVASDVTIEDGAQLLLPELLALASDDVVLEAGASVAARGAPVAHRSAFDVRGDNALLLATTGAQPVVKHSGESGARGSVSLQTGASLFASGALALDGSRNTRVAGQLATDQGSLRLASSRISVGAVNGVSDGLVLSNAQLRDLAARELIFDSRSSLDVYGSVNADIDSLVINAAGIIGHTPGGDVARFTADSITLANANGRTDAGAQAVSAAPGSVLRMTARDMKLGPGRFDIAGFEQLALTAHEQLMGLGTTTLASRGALTLDTGRLTTASGAHLAINAERATLRATGSKTLPASDSLGGTLAINADAIDYAGRISLPAGRVELNASGAGGVRVRNGASIDVAATREVFGGKTVAVPGGRIALRATQGDIAIDRGASLDVSASGGGLAGVISTQAAAGTISVDPRAQLQARGAQGSGAWLFDAEAFAADTSLSVLNTQLNGNGFGDTRVFRVRHGDLSLAPGAAIEAHAVTLSADQGAITIAGRIDASGRRAGRIALNADGDVTLTGSARLDASAAGANEAGGVVSIATRAGALQLAATDNSNDAGIDVAGAGDGGSVVLRAPRIGASEVAVTDASVRIAGASRITLEAFKNYSGSNVGTVFNSARGEAATFMANAATIESRLGRDSDARFHVVPGIDITSSGNLTLASNLDLMNERYDGEPGVLSLRAAGNLAINGSLSDGIAFQTFIDPSSGEEFAELGERDRVQSGPSWSYRLTAGADLDSADITATRAGSGDVVVAANRHVRTGTGSLDITAGGQLRLAGAGASIYTAGEQRGTGGFDPILTEGLLRADYLYHGGNIRIDTQGGVRGVAGKALPDWLARIGGNNLQIGERVPSAWAINVGAFTQGIGALGGGAVSIRSAGSLTDVDIALPTNGQPITSAAGVDIAGGGHLDVDVDGNIASGVFLLGRGAARVKAGGDIIKSKAASLATVLQLGDGEFDVTAGGKLRLESVFNPTLTPVSPSQSVEAFGSASSVYFSTYGVDSRLHLTALAGDVLLDSRDAGVRAPYGDRNFGAGDVMALSLAPPSLQAASLRRNLVLANSLILAPAARGQLDLLAAGSLITPNVQTRIRLIDTDIAALPSPVQAAESLNALPAALLSDVPGIGHGAVPLHMGDGERARIVARSGDIGASNGKRLEITLSKQALIEAGRDIINLSYSGQHVDGGDHSVVHAGRDVLFSTLRNPLGVLQINQARYEFSGPGQFDVLAGRDVDLGSSDGILSSGRLRNPALAAGAGSLTVMAGLASAPDYAAFVQRYLRKGHAYERALAQFVASHGGSGKGAVLAQFEALSVDDQQQFVHQAFFNEIKQAGLTASKSGDTAGDYSRGFAAIDTLFKARGGRGDIISLLSRIQTLDGGDINLLAPYGAVNAGAAALTGLAKTPDQLGIVVQRSGDLNAFTAGDFLVNSSRVFALDGGSILMWSSRGNIDAGRGAKSALSIPPPVVSFDALGNVITEFPPAVAGSGIQAAVSTAGRAPGNVFLFAPGGIVDAGDAGIASAGNLTIAATAVLGADNISVGGVATGVPTATVSVPVGLAGASAAAGSASNAAANAAADSFNDKDQSTQDLGKAMVSMISVEFLGFGE